jgi:amidase
MDKTNPPALTVDSGDVIVVDCIDANSGAIRTPEDTTACVDIDRINPATGPIFVRSCEIGDVLAVHIFRIDVAEQGSASIWPGTGLLSSGEQAHAMPYFTKIAKVENGLINYRDNIRIPVHPMIGTFGVAPAGEPIGCLYPGNHGGNMDMKDVCAGNTVYLPVFAPGALLAMGDAKAVIGDGESAGAGLESDVTITLQVEVVKGCTLSRPLIESSTEFMTCGWGMSMEEAAACAMGDMTDMLSRKLGLPRVEAYNLAGLIGNVRPGNCVSEGAPRAMRFIMPKAIFQDGIELP